MSKSVEQSVALQMSKISDISTKKKRGQQILTASPSPGEI